MISGDRLLDTNIVVALFNGDQPVIAKLQAISTVYLSTIVVGELYYGAHASHQVELNVARLEGFAGDVTVLPVSRWTARHYGQLKGRLRTIGKPIPDNDLWIAAIALEHDLILATRDAHFAGVEGLQQELW